MDQSADLGLMTGFDQWRVDRNDSILVPNLGLKRYYFQLPSWVCPQPWEEPAPGGCFVFSLGPRMREMWALSPALTYRASAEPCWTIRHWKTYEWERNGFRVQKPQWFRGCLLSSIIAAETWLVQSIRSWVIWPSIAIPTSLHCFFVHAV